MTQQSQTPVRAMESPLGFFNSEKHLEKNASLATPRDTARGLFFNGALDAVTRQMGADVARRCREVTGERKHVDFFNYPVSSFLKLCLAVVKEVGPRHGGCEGTLRWIGEQSARDFLSSMAGKTVVLLAGGSVTRLLNQVPSSYRAAVSYGTRTLTCTEQRTGRFVIHNDFLPHAYHEGVLLGVLGVAGARNARVRGVATGPLDSEYEFSWEE